MAGSGVAATGGAVDILASATAALPGEGQCMGARGEEEVEKGCRQVWGYMCVGEVGRLVS